MILALAYGIDYWISELAPSCPNTSPCWLQISESMEQPIDLPPKSYPLQGDWLAVDDLRGLGSDNSETSWRFLGYEAVDGVGSFLILQEELEGLLDPGSVIRQKLIPARTEPLDSAA